ncbi:huntingtin interacting protein, putative [Ricinus communis]|uniref:Huntingtin interacting protein, putative n=1 Tax=Ricinus communis TaxID=3988 RepID=B9S2T8_RICCO|nr:huntingtin interacting protein, putative [Ricinus communis]
MGSCENSLEVEVVPKSIHQTAVEQLQHQNACLIKVLESEQEQLPCLEGFHISNSDNVGPSSMLDGCTEFSKNDKAGSLRLEDASVVDKGIGLACENGNAASLVPGEMLEDECGITGAITSPRSCQSFGASRNSSYRELDAPHLIGKDGFSVIYSSSAVDYSEATNNGGEDLVINDCPSTTGRSEIRLSSSRRSSRTRKSSRKPQTKRAAKKSGNKDKVRDVQIFKAERRKRSCFSKPARSSNWGLLGNIAQFFEQSNGLGLNETHNHEPFQTKVGRGGGKRNNSRAGGSSQRFSVKRHASTSGIRLKVKVGNEVVRDSLNIIVPEVIDTSASAGVVGGDFEAKSYQGTSFGVPNFANFLEVKMGEEGTEEQPECFANKLEAARIHSDASVSDVHVVNKNSESIVISQKLSGDSEAYYVGVPSHVEVETLNAATEKRYTDPGTSPDSEVINLGPEGQVNTRSQEDFADAVLTSSKAFIAPGVVPVSKKGKKKGRVTHASEFFPEDKSPGVASSTKVKAGKNRGVRQRKSGEVFPSENFNSSTGANASSNLSSSKECSDEQLPLSGETELIDSREDLPDELTETKISSVLDVGLRLSEAQTSSNLLSSTKSKGCRLPRKSGGASKGECKVSDKERSRREDGCRQRRKEQKSVKRNKVKEKNDYNENEEADPEIGNCIADDTQKFNPHDTIASVAVANLDMASSDAVDQHLPMDNAWVRCDECLKWRRIPVALVDSIGQTNCHWICKDNMDKAFADCSISQEKSNAEINAELGLSDADEDACDVPLKNRGLEYKRTAASKEHEFTRISTNQFLHRSRKTQTIDEIMVCHCKLPLDGRLGCRDECLNRMLNIECVRGTCPCGDLCSNQQVLDMHTYEARQREYAFQGHKHFYFMTLNGSEVIDACAKGNLGRFINHSCDPNCRTEKWVVNGEICIGLFALRDIKKGEELTFDYNYVRVCGAAAKRCYCGSPQCRGYIGGDPTNTEVIDQVDSDEEFLEPVMLEVGEAGYRIRNRISRSSSCDDVELQVTESISNNRDKMDSSTTAAQKMEAATEIKDSMNPSIPAISRLDSSLEVDDLKESFPSSRQQADDATIEFFPAVKQENSIEQIQGLDTSSATVLSKLSSDDMVANRKPKTDEKRVFVKSRFLIKTSCESGLAKKGKFGSIHSNVNKVQMMACKSQVLSLKPKKFTDGTTSGRFEAVEGKLNELLDNDGGISKRKDAAKGYLKFLLLTAASGASGNGEAIQSNRDLSMILDALLKTKSRAVLIDIINKNGLRMLHNMLKQYRSDFKKTPILRKLLKVLEYLAVREILTPEHIYGGPPCPGMESFRKSMLSLTEHNDKQVHQIARSFRDRWFPRHGRKYSYMDRDDGKMECHRGSISNRVSASQDHLRDLTIRPTEVIDGAMQPKVTTASVETAVNEGCSLHCVGDDTKTRKRKSRWDQPAEEKPFRRSHQHDEQRIQSGLLEQSRFNPPTDMGKEVSEHADKRSGENSCCPHCVRNYCRQVEADCADLGRQTIQSDAPPGFSSPLNPPLVLPNASSTIIDGLTFPVDMVVGHPQRKFNSRLSVSYGIPLPIVQQFGLPQHGTVGSWTIAPGMPFHPFPPLPPFPHHKNETPAAAISMAIDGTAEEGQQLRQDPPTCYPNENNLSTNAINQPDIVFPGENSQTFKRVRASSQDLGRRYFRQQKWNKGPPWMHQVNGWGHLGSNSKGVICSTDVVSVTNEPRNSYCSQDVSCRMEKAGDCINQQNST